MSDSPYIHPSNADVRRGPLHPPHPTTRHTSNNTCICLLRGPRAKLLHRKMDAADALPLVAMVKIALHKSYLCISAEVCRQILVLLVWRGVGCGGWKGISPYAGIRMGGIGWNYRGLLWLAEKGHQLKDKQSRQTRVYLGFVQPKTGTMRFGPMAGLVW